MDELPELRSDEDVDALMARLRAKLGPVTQAVSDPHLTTEPSADPLSDFLAAQGELTTTMIRAMTLLANVFDELEGESMTIASKAAPSRLRRIGAGKKTAASRRTHRRIRR